ncbi:hypothetical protein ACFXAF_12455 [Kitasatospora sp. NPDC059463]|uniref:hypothetical protein n=1 Tax=unclassified Kitasatospora TaxID=2633591 RepID=UPI0036973B7D
MAWTEYADCPACGRPVAVYTPRHGDGTIRLTRWHKTADGQWCRVELDIGDHDIRKTRHP